MTSAFLCSTPISTAFKYNIHQFSLKELTDGRKEGEKCSPEKRGLQNQFGDGWSKTQPGLWVPTQASWPATLPGAQDGFCWWLTSASVRQNCVCPTQQSQVFHYFDFKDCFPLFVEDEASSFIFSLNWLWYGKALLKYITSTTGLRLNSLNTAELGITNICCNGSSSRFSVLRSQSDLPSGAGSTSYMFLVNKWDDQAYQPPPPWCFNL